MEVGGCSLKKRMVDLLKQVTELRAQVTKDSENTKLALMRVQGEIDRVKKNSWTSEGMIAMGFWMFTVFACIVGAMAEEKRKRYR